MEKYTPYILPAIFVAFIIYRRVRKAIGFQKYSANFLAIRITFFSLLAAFLLILTILNPKALIADTVGALLGLGLVYVAIKETVFEKRNDALYYRTHIWIELTILILFFARLLYRLYLFYGQMNQNQSPEEAGSQMRNMRDPFTGALFFILCAYYIAYCSYIFHAGRKQLATERI